MSSASNYLTQYEISASDIRKKDIYHKADVVELICLQNDDKEIPIDEALDEQMGGEEGIGGIFNIDEEDTDDTDTEGAAERYDAASLELTDISEHLRSRSELFGDYYPFSCAGNLISLKETTTDQHKLYTFLLMASHLRFWPRPDRSLFTKDFEVLSACTLKHLVPTWIIKIMGTAQHNDFPGYTGSRRNKLEALAQELGLRLMMDEDELLHFDAPGGDGQLDVVAWYACRDGAANMPVILGQAGCTENEDTMISKQIDAQTWGKRLRGLDAIPCFFSPQHYRLSNNAWVDSTQVHGIFLDRFRIMSLLFNNDDFQISDFPSMKKIDTIFS